MNFNISDFINIGIMNFILVRTLLDFYELYSIFELNRYDNKY